MPWLYSEQLHSQALDAVITQQAAALRQPRDPVDVAALSARHNALLTAENKSQRTQARTQNRPVYRLVKEDAQLSGAAAAANQKIQAILQQYQAKKAAQTNVAAAGPQFFLESADGVTAANGGALFDLCHQLNRLELKAPLCDELLELNSVEGLYQLPLWALRLNLGLGDLDRLELMALPLTKAGSNYRGPLRLIIRLNFAETSLVHLTELDYEEAAQVSCAGLLSEIVAEVDATLLAQASGANFESVLDRCYDAVVGDSLRVSEQLLLESLLLAPYFKADTPAEARLSALHQAACALGYVLTHLGAIKATNNLAPQATEPVTLTTLPL